jgi:hypothetical protein
VKLTAAAKVIRYRVEQFLRALTAQHAISKRRLESAAELLPPQARALFVQQAPQDQRHALAVYETLLEGGHTNKDLLTAALLHDVGKVASHAPTWQRSIFVLADRFAPRMLGRVLRDGGGGWRSPLITYAKHAEISARWAQEAGCSAVTVELIRHHEHRADACETAYDRLLSALQAADSIN